MIFFSVFNTSEKLLMNFFSYDFDFHKNLQSDGICTGRVLKTTKPKTFLK